MSDSAELMRQLKDGRPLDRVQAAEALGASRDPAAVSALIDALKIFREPHGSWRGKQ